MESSGLQTELTLDTCVWGGTCQVIADASHDVIWTGEWENDPGDYEILAYAYQEGRILITLDKDFGELAIVFNQPHTGILRLVNLSARQQGPICVQVLASHGALLQAGAIVTVDSRRLRVRPPKK
jgi:predicted nuclease of predicted toxin-antitoxin system